MKILVLPSWYIPNGGYFFKEQSLALAHKGYDVSVLPVNEYSIRMINRIPKPNSLFKIRKADEDGLRTFRCDYLGIPKGNEFVNLRIRRYITEKVFKYYVDKYGTPDLIHVHSVIWGGYIASILKAKYGIPYVITEHRGRFVNNKYVDPNQLKEEYTPYIRDGLKNADRVITVSNSLNQKLTSYDATITKRLITIPNMVDTEFFVPEPQSMVNDGCFTFFCLGGLVFLKGFDLVIKAFKTVSDKYANCRLVIGGEGPEKYNLERLVIDLDLQDKIVFLGQLNRTQVREQMQNSHVFILPTRYEAFGVVYIEALSCGIPIVGTRAGGPENIIDETNGLLVDPDDVMQLADAMITIIDNYDKYDFERIRQDAVNKYSIEVVVESIIREFKNVLQ
jgi:glycosyltransferase involved in cell wall biosynthesis